MKFILLFLLVSFLFYSCNFKKIGADAAQGAGSSLKKDVDTIGMNAAHGIVYGFTDSVSNKKIQDLADSIAAAFGSRIVNKASEASDSLFKKKIWNWADSLVEALTGKKTQLNIQEIQASFFGKTKTDIADIKNMIEELIDHITSTHTKNKLDELVDELVGDRTNSKLRALADSLVSHLVDTAFAKINRDYKNGIGNSVTQTSDIIRDNARMLLVILAGIAAITVFLVWWNRRKYLRLTTILTKHIDGIADQKVYDKVTQSIKSDAITAGVEGQLRSVLSENGLLHTH